jgi:hypothetical protein
MGLFVVQVIKEKRKDKISVERRLGKERHFMRLVNGCLFLAEKDNTWLTLMNVFLWIPLTRS